jgi:predicted metal-dependent phosphoesterase TrpH
MEVFTELGDMLVFGWEENIRYYLFPFKELKKEVEKRKGIIIPAHPCRGDADVRHSYNRDFPEELLTAIVAIETKNGSLSRKSNEKAEELAVRYSLFGTGGSDAHHESHIGKCVTVFEDEPSNERELIEALKSGRYRAVYFEELSS